MPAQPRSRASYDHRLRAEIVRSRNVGLAIDLGVPRSTIGSWLARGVPANVVTLGPEVEFDEAFALRLRVRRLERQVRVLAMVVRLLQLAKRMERSAAVSNRVDAPTRRAVLRALERARAVMTQRAARRILGLSPGRVRAWRERERECRLEDAPSCPRSQPARLTRTEISAMRNLVLSEEHRAFGVRVLNVN